MLESGGDNVKIEARRKLSTTDSYDFTFPLEQAFDCGWAYNSGTNSLSYKHSKRGSVSLTLNEVIEEEEEEVEQLPEQTQLA